MPSQRRKAREVTHQESSILANDHQNTDEKYLQIFTHDFHTNEYENNQNFYISISIRNER